MSKTISQVSGLEFRLIGGAWQPVVENFSHLETVLALDEAWFAITGIDTNSLRADKKFLEFMDTDKNGKIRTDEIKEAIKFMLDVLKDGSGFNSSSRELELKAVNEESTTGAEILSSAKLVLSNLGKADADVISLNDIRDEKQIKSCVLCNGDGVITPDAVPENIAKIVELVIKSVGAVQDLSGNNGINTKGLDDFSAAVKAVLAWYCEADAVPEFLPFGEKTKEILDVYLQIKEAVNDYFLSSETLAFLNSDPERIAKKESTADVRTPAEVLEMLKKLAIAAPDPGGELNLAGAINPLWKERIGKFFSFPDIETNLTDRKLTQHVWQQITAKLAPAEGWYKRRPDHPVLLAVPRKELEEAAAEENISAIRELIARDLEAGTALAKLETLHKLLLFQCNMLEFLRNSLNLSALFDPNAASWLQTGMLIMDGRHFSLAVPVNNLPEHKKIAADSNICTAYVEITRGLPGALTKQLLAVAITSGNMRNLFPGKRGIFFDAAGDVYDARITDFIRQPVSIGEALKSPFFRLGEFLGKQADKILTTRSNAAQQELSKTLTSGKIPPAQDPKQQGISGSMLLMGGGIGIAAIGSSVAFIVKSLQNISFLNIITILCGIIVVFGGPIIAVSLVKLYRRDLGRFLEASGCALNFPLRLSRKLGNFFTLAPKRPISSWLAVQKVGITRSTSFLMIILIIVTLMLLTAGITLYLLQQTF